MHTEAQLQETETTKEALYAAKQRLEHEIARLEKKDLNDHTRSLAQKLNELQTALSTMQEMLNIVWKQTEHIHHELGTLRTKTE